MSLDLLTSSKNHPSPPTHRSFAWLLPVGLILGFLIILTLLFGQRLLPATEVRTAPIITIRQSADSEIKPTDTPTSTAITKGKMIFQASGWIEPDPYVTYVPVLINGVIDQLHVLEGQTVKKGDLLATLVDDEAKLDLQEAEVKIKSLEARIAAHCVGADISYAEIGAIKKKIDALKALSDDAIDNLTRLEKLPAEAIPEQQVVQARLATIRHAALVAEAEAAIPKLEAQVQQIALEKVAMTSNLAELDITRDQATLALQRTQIISPMHARVLNLHAAPGKKRMLNMDDPDSAVIVSLYDPEKLQARIDVPLTEAAGILEGQSVELTSDILPDTIFHGKVTRISGQADIQRNTLQVKVEIKNPDHRLRPEMLVRGKFFSHSASKRATSSTSSDRLALFVPEEAIFNNNSAWIVSTDQTAELRTIQLGDELRDGHRLVLDGLRSGEQVILPPHTDLTEGSRLTIH